MGSFIGIIMEKRCVLAEGLGGVHAQLLERVGIKDIEANAKTKFVKVEMKFISDEWWTDPDNWKININQDILPDWYKENYEKYDLEFRKAVKDWCRTHVFVDRQLSELKDGYYLLRNCNVQILNRDAVVELSNSNVRRMLKNATVLEMRQNSSINEMFENTVVQRMSDSSFVNTMYGRAIVSNMLDNTKVHMMSENAKVKEMSDNARVTKMFDQSQVEKMSDNSGVQAMYYNTSITEMHDNTNVRMMCDKSLVRKMYQSAMVKTMCDYAQIEKMYGNATIQEMYEDAKVLEMHGNSIRFSYDGKITQYVSEECQIERAVHCNTGDLEITKNLSWEEILKNAEVQYYQLLMDNRNLDQLSEAELAKMEADKIIWDVIKYANTKEDANYLLRETIWLDKDMLWGGYHKSIDIVQDYVDKNFGDMKDIKFTGGVNGRKRFLPEGWEWSHYDDGSGYLKAPDGKHYFSYDLLTKEFQQFMEKPGMQYLDDMCLRRFVRYAEDTVFEKLEEERSKCMETEETKLESEKTSERKLQRKSR